jgi:acetylornithine deacetylase
VSPNLKSLAAVAVDMSLADLTRDLVSIPSHEDEREAGAFIADWLREHTDASVVHTDVGNVIARRNEDADTSLALVGHHDVVPPDDDQLDEDGYAVMERDGRLYGRGAADMKGSLAAAMVAFRDSEIREVSTGRGDPDNPGCELVFASFAGEEEGGVGCRAAIEEGFAPDYGIVGEGSTGYSGEGVTDVAVAHKGRRGATVTAEGEAAHASEPEAGDNAIYRAADAVDIVRHLPAPETRVLGHELSGSVVVTEIEGGSGWNVIPEGCEFTVDERTVPGERAELGQVESLFGVSLEIDQDLPPMACDDADFAEAVLDGADAAQEAAPEQVVKPHATDAGWLANRAETTCVVCGAAEPGEAHTASESVSLDAVERCAEVYRHVAERAPLW